MHNACIIEHMLRHNIIPKANDHLYYLSPLYSHIIMTNTFFKLVDHLFLYIKKLIIIRSLRLKKKYKLTLGHLITYLLELNYNISYPIKLDHIPSHFIDHSFHALYSEKRWPTQAVGQEKEKRRYILSRSL